MRKSLLHKLSDISKIHHRAAFSDVKERTASKESKFLTLAKERYSCRAFKDKEVGEELIAKVLEAATLAPTAVNKQPVHVWVVRSDERRKALAEATKYTFNAPVVFMVGCKPSEAWVRSVDGKNGAETDASIVGTHIMMEIADLGLGTTWVGSFDPSVILKSFPETEGWDIIALFPTGYPDGEPSPRHSERKTVEEIASFL